MHYHSRWVCISLELYRRTHVSEYHSQATGEELVIYPSVHLHSMHEWDPLVLDYSHPEGDEEPVWACDPQHIDLIDPSFDTHGLYTRRAIKTF